MAANQRYPNSIANNVLQQETIRSTVDAKAFTALNYAGGLPTGVTQPPAGILYYDAEVGKNAPIVTQGTYPILVEPGQTIIPGDKIVINAFGRAIKSTAGSDYIFGLAKDSSTGSTTTDMHYILIKIVG